MSSLIWQFAVAVSGKMSYYSAFLSEAQSETGSILAL